MMVIDDPAVGMPKAKVGHPKKNMIIVDAKSSGHKSNMAFLSKCLYALVVE